MNNLIGILITAILGLISSIITYRLGRKAKVDEIILNKGYPIAEQIAILFQEIVETDQYYYDLYIKDFASYDRIEEALARSFLRFPNLYQPEYDRIEAHMQKREQLFNQLHVARLYLNQRIIDKARAYLDLGLFTYISDGGVLHGFEEFHEEFFRNIGDKEKHKKRAKIAKEVMKGLRNLVRL